MSRLAKKLNLIAIDTHMGMLDYSIRCIFGGETNSYKYIDNIFENKENSVQDIYNDEQMGNVARGVTFYKTGYVPIIWMPRQPKTPREHATFAHEVIHAVNHLFGWANIPLSKDTEEVFAHSVAHVIDSVYTKLKK